MATTLPLIACAFGLALLDEHLYGGGPAFLTTLLICLTQLLSFPFALIVYFTGPFGITEYVVPMAWRITWVFAFCVNVYCWVAIAERLIKKMTHRSESEVSQ